MKEFIESAGWVLPESVLLIGGVVVFCVWVARTRFGRKAFPPGGVSEPKRNNMHLAVPFIVMLAYFVGAPCVFVAVCRLWKIADESWQYYFTYNVVSSIISVIVSIAIILLVRRSFARGLKGFGFNLRTIVGDFGSAVLNFWAVFPVLTGVLLLTIEIGKLIYGSDYIIGQHQELKTIATYSQSANGGPLVVSVVLAAVLTGPVLEELLFRGLFQNMVRSAGYGPWASIAICSFIFVIFHAIPSHWPALFILSMGIGYSYEKSGLMFRPIFFHAIFNAVSVIAALLAAQPVT
jgi:membrane protease YdiL (CAAX protease family)